MSSIGDPAKLKVVELRAELSKRGLDSKGNKPALVKRLKEALEKELKEELPDTSIADTSTEDLDTSQVQETPSAEACKSTSPPEPPETSEKIEKEEEQSEPKENTVEQEIPEQNIEEMDSENIDNTLPPEPADAIDPSENLDKSETATPVDNKESKENGQQSEPAPKVDAVDDIQMKEDASANVHSGKAEEVKHERTELKGEKRRHTSPSPERSQRKRSKSPIKEDEPPIDSDKVQLSWYDSDLHLQLDKESFLSAKPYHEGAFGFAWAGVRATHGVAVGQVCYEVKITEELKWEDFSKHQDKHHENKSESKQKSTKSVDNKAKTVEADETKEKATEAAETKEKATEAGETKEKATKVAETKELASDTGKTEEKATKISENENGETVDEGKEEKSKTAEDENKSTSLKENDVEGETSEPGDTKSQENLEDDKQKEQEPIPTHLFRIGWSLPKADLQLGEDAFSYGYESSGRFVSDKIFQDYGLGFGVGDVIASFLNIAEDVISISYAVNGILQPVAIQVPKSELPEGFAFFPHISSRNFAFELNLGEKQDPWFSKPEEVKEYKFLADVEEKIIGPVRPQTRNECEVILMCGLPASGKTHWVREYVQENSSKKYTILGNSQLLEKMTVSGSSLKSKYLGSWNTLLDKLQKCLNRLIETAALRRRNFIIDQTNVFPSAQRRKLRSFEGFKRRAVVVVVGDEEQAKRQSLQEAQDGKDVPDSAILEMKAIMTLPQKGEWIDEVIYAELNEEEAKAVVQKYNIQGREAGYGIQRRFGYRDDRNRWQHRRNDYRSGNFRNRNYQNRYERGPPRQGNWHPQRLGGWNRDRRDNRGPPAGGPRDWRNNRGNGRDRGNRDDYSQGSNYNRHRNPPRSPGGNWQSGNWAQGQGNWGAQPWGPGWNQGGWAQNNANQWKYGGGGGGGQNYGSYSSWGYYGHYPQNWGQAQGQTASTGANEYGQYSQQEWAQYAQQYAQQGQSLAGSTTNQSAVQK